MQWFVHPREPVDRKFINQWLLNTSKTKDIVTEYQEEAVESPLHCAFNGGILKELKT